MVSTSLVIDEWTGMEKLRFMLRSENQAREQVCLHTELLHDKGLTTDIDWRNKDFAGAGINSILIHAKIFRRLRRQHQRTRISNSKERNLSVALAELQRLGSQMDLPKNVREQAAYIYRKAVEKGLVRGRSIEGVVAASIYASCRMGQIPRTLDEVGAYSRTGRKEIAEHLEQ